MKEHKKQSIKNSPPTHPSPSRGEGKGGGEKDIALLHPIRSPLSRRGWRGNEKGLALVMILILSAIALAIMAGLIYMITSSTQISGMQKRYKTALEAGVGGADVTYQFISLRGNSIDTASLILTFSDVLRNPINPVITTSNSCTGTDISGISFSGFEAKLKTPSTSWSSACDKDNMSITPGTTTSYDMRFDLGSSLYPPTYRVYAKIVSTVEGNSAVDRGLLGAGVVGSGSGEVKVMSVPYLYTVEMDAQNLANPSERAKLSILYQY